MKHARHAPTEEDYLEMEPMEEEPMEEEGYMVCDLCGGSREGLITLQNENGFVICADCIDGLANIFVQVRCGLAEDGDLYEHRSLN